MATSTQQQQELFKAIWAIVEDLRNSVDGWDFTSYVLGILFYSFISEYITNYINNMQHEVGESGFDYAKFSDEEAESAREQLVKDKGFFILPSQLFCNVSFRAKSDIKEINTRIARIVEHENRLRAEIDVIIRESEEDTL